MDSCRSRQAWLMVGFLWFLLGIAWAPSSKLYLQGLIYLFCLPALLLWWQASDRLYVLWRCDRLILVGLVLFTGWVGGSVSWSTAVQPVRELKHVLYVLFFLGGMLQLSKVSRQSLVRVMQLAAWGLAIAALVSLAKTYGVEHKKLWSRLVGIGELDHPILGGYVMGCAAVWCLCLPPSRTAWRVGWGICLLLLLLFVVMTQSRGAWLAMLVTALFMPVWRRGLGAKVISMLLLLISVIGYWNFAWVALRRGASYRPEILQASLQMIAERPWFGLGLGSDYEVKVASLGLIFDHSHNIFTHVAIELGIPGLLCWLLVWGGSFRVAWQQRGTALGSALLGMLLFSTVALLFDGASLWGSPRPEWFLTWLPVGLALMVTGCSPSSSSSSKPLCYHASPLSG